MRHRKLRPARAERLSRHGDADARSPHRGSRGRRYVYTYASKPSLAAVKAKVKAITRSGSNQTLGQLLHRLNPVLRGWCAYFRGGVSGRTFSYLRAYTWRRVLCWLRRKHPKATWRWLRRRYLPRWWPTDGETVLYDPDRCALSTTAYRGAKIATPWGQGRVAVRQGRLRGHNRGQRAERARRGDPRDPREQLADPTYGAADRLGPRAWIDCELIRVQPV